MTEPDFRLRLARPEDAGGCLAIYRPIVQTTPTSFEIEVPGEKVFADRIAAHLKTYPWLVVSTEAGEIRGYAYASSHRQREAYQWCTEVSAYVATASRGVGRNPVRPPGTTRPSSNFRKDARTEEGPGEIRVERKARWPRS